MPKSSFTSDYERFRNILIETRKATGITQAELSAKLSRPQSYVSKYERGERRLDVIEFIQITRALGVDPHKLIRNLVGRTTK